MTDFMPFKAARTVGFKCVCVMSELFKAARTVGFKGTAIEIANKCHHSSLIRKLIVHASAT